MRKATKKRNAPFTFKEDGFYKTLKKEIVEVLPSLPKQAINTSNFFIDSFLVIMFFLATLAATYWNFFLGALAGNFLAFLTIAAHNYFHQKDSFRMYYFNFSLQTVREWRISHVLSHHLHTNTIDDFEISSWEPVLNYLPVQKDPVKKYLQWLVAPLVWMFGFHRAFVERYVTYLKKFWQIYFIYSFRVLEFIHGRRNHVKKTDLIPFILPLFMYIFSGQTLLGTFIMWNFIVIVGSTHVFFVGLHAGHHHPETFHDGDHPRYN